MSIWDFVTDEDSDDYFRAVAHEMDVLFGMSFEEAVCRINGCYRGTEFLIGPDFQLEMPEDEANDIVLGPSWWKDADERQLRPAPANYDGISVSRSLNKTRKIPSYPDLSSMPSDDLGDYIVAGSYFHFDALGTLLSRLGSSDIGEIVLRVLGSAPTVVFDGEDGIGRGFIVGELIRYGSESVRLKSWDIYNDMSDDERAGVASNYLRIHKEELRRS